MTLLGMQNDAEFLKNLADALDSAPRSVSDSEQDQGEKYIMISDTLARVLADGIREVYRRSFLH